jgi:hypothetical protein
MVLFTYLVGVVFEHGVVVAGSFHWSSWAERAASMIEARGSVE